MLETRRLTPISRPDIEVIEVLDHWNGTTQFLASYVRYPAERPDGPTIYGLIYGCITEESADHLDSDDPRTYGLWTLPPQQAEPQWHISEDELVYAEGTRS